MSKRKGKTNIKLDYLDQINQIDKRLKKTKIKNNDEEKSKLLSKRQGLTQRLKTNK